MKKRSHHAPFKKPANPSTNSGFRPLAWSNSQGKNRFTTTEFQGLIKDNGLIYCILMWNIFGVEANIDQGNTSFANCCMHKRRRNRILIGSVLSLDVFLYCCLLFVQTFLRSGSSLTPSSVNLDNSYKQRTGLHNHYT